MPSGSHLDGTQWFALLKTTFFFVVFPGTVAGYVPYLILQRPTVPTMASFDALRWMGFSLILVATLALLPCGWHFATRGRGTPAPFDPPKALVASGPYRWVRNPMYCCVVAALIGETLLFRSTALLGYAAMVWLIFQLFVLLYEEPTLREQFGPSYDEYCRRVWRWIPRPPR